MIAIGTRESSLACAASMSAPRTVEFGLAPASTWVAQKNKILLC